MLPEFIKSFSMTVLTYVASVFEWIIDSWDKYKILPYIVLIGIFITLSLIIYGIGSLF